MNTSGDSAAEENPFSARYLRPGAIPYQFASGQSVESLIRRLRKNGWRGQVVGPHGSGKSALLAALIVAIEESGRQTVLIELHDGQRRLPVDLRRLPGVAGGTILFVDGYEQLSPLSRFLLGRCCRRRGLGLVVTAHGSVGFADLCRTTSSLRLAHQLVHRLLGEHSSSMITSDEVDERFAFHQGDLREMLFDLYDLYERRHRGGNASSDSTES